MTDSPFEITELSKMSGTSFRACVIAFGLALDGRQVSLSEVARQTGVSRQALHKDHKEAVRFVAWLRQEWSPPPEALRETAKIEAELAVATSRIRIEKQKRQKAEAERDRALHHLELAVATLELSGERARGSLLPLRRTET